MSTKTGRYQDGGVALEELPLEKSYEEEKDRRLSLILSSSVFDDLNAMAKARRTTMTEIVRLALGLIKVALKEAKEGHKLVVTKATGEVLKELVLPG